MAINSITSIMLTSSLCSISGAGGGGGRAGVGVGAEEEEGEAPAVSFVKEGGREEEGGGDDDVEGGRDEEEDDASGISSSGTVGCSVLLLATAKLLALELEGNEAVADNEELDCAGERVSLILLRRWKRARDEGEG